MFTSKFNSKFLLHAAYEELNLIQIVTYQWFYLAILRPYMGVIPNPKLTFIFPISCFLVLFSQF